MSGREAVVELERMKRRLKVKHHKIIEPTSEEYAQDVQAVKAALMKGLKFEKPQGSSLHHLMQYVAETGMMNNDGEALIKNNFQSIVVEHDWAASMVGIEGFNDDGEIPMPFDWTCFEFRITGLRVLALVGEHDGTCYGIVCTGVNGRWYVNAEQFDVRRGKFTAKWKEDDPYTPEDSDFKALAEKFLHMLSQQIRAVCIILDAGVGETDVCPASPALNKKRREQGRMPLKDYHIVRLHRRHTRSDVRGPATGRHVRAHYRRGHWRHYKDGASGREQYIDNGILCSKTYIHWMIVGDINLGFVDKEYRL
jgi:hypothetical protein